MIAPPALNQGDVIGIAAPSSGFDRRAFEAGVAWLRAQGFEVRYREDIHERYHYLAGSRARREAELQEMLDSPDLAAILFARGGFGLMHLLGRVRLDGLVSRPRVVLGHSDLTPLLNWITQEAGLITFHGPLVAGLGKTGRRSLDQMIGLLSQPGRIPDPLVSSGGPQVRLRGGRAAGRLCGGNLSLVAATLGTPFEIDTRSKLLLLEEVGERPYRVDRLLAQLHLAGKLQEAAGLVIGEFKDCREPGGGGRPILDIVAEYAGEVPGPVVAGFPFGHGEDNLTLPIGARAVLDGDTGKLELVQPAVT